MRRFAFGLLALAGMVGTSLAAPYMPPRNAPATLVKIYDNLARKYPLGLYNKLNGDSIVGPDSASVSPVYAFAQAFAPDIDRVIKRIQVSVQKFSGTDAITVALYDDSAGKPGSALKTWHMTGVPPGGSCCAVLTAKSAVGIAVSGGQTYWVVVKTDAPSHDFNGTWLFNVTDQVTFMPQAVYCQDRPGVATCSNFPSGQWTPTQSAPGHGYSVYGN